MRPIGDARYVFVLDRVVVNVIEVSLEVPLIANEMLPESSLPDTAFAVVDARF